MSNVCHLTYTVDGISREYEYPAERLDELIARAEAKFCQPETAADRERFRLVLQHDRERRAEQARERRKQADSTAFTRG